MLQKKLIIIIYITFILTLIYDHTKAQENFIDFESARWELRNAKVVEHLDRKSLVGNAFLTDVEFENGVIEVDVAVNGKRSYPGIIFRMESEGNYERFYIRPHRAGLYPDALQYVPAFNGIDGWQLYNGEGFTAESEIPANEWVHIRLEVNGTQARIFINNAKQPALKITELKRGNSKGKIGLNGPADGTAYFSNFSYKIDNSLTFEPVQPIESLPGTISEWDISQTFNLSELDIEKYPQQQILNKINWQTVKSEPSGLIDISRFTGRKSRAPSCIIAKTTIHVDEQQTMKLSLGYSDAVTFFLNGMPQFFGNSAYRQRDPSFLGIIGYNDAVYLPLNKGQNELLLYVAESFGGWGFMACDENAVFEYSTLEKKWEITQDLKMPESTVYDKKRDVIYVTNYDYYGIPGKQFISILNCDGSIQKLNWIEGFNRPLGMAIHKDKLYVVDRKNISEIDLDKNEISNRYALPNPLFPNDLTIDKSGNIYVSDTFKGVIYKFSNNKFEDWLSGPEIVRPNGIYAHKNQLILGTSGDHAIKAFDLVTKEMSVIAKFSEGIMDGIKADKDGNLIIGHYEGRLYKVTPAGQKILLYYNPSTRCADYCYIEKQDLLVIPTLQDNSIFTYKLN